VSRRDGGFALVLVILLVALAGITAAPSLRPAATPAPSATPVPAAGHVQGVLGTRRPSPRSRPGTRSIATSSL
jgi:hypothetical protein